MTNPATCANGHDLWENETRFCETCGVAVACPQGHPVDDATLAFCEVCGEALGGSGGVVTAARGGVPRLPLFIGAAVVAVAAVAAVTWLAFGRGDDETPPTDDGGSRPTATRRASTTPAVSASPSPRATASATGSAAAGAGNPTAAPPTAATAPATATTAPPPTAPPPTPTPRPPTATTAPAPTPTATTAPATGECFLLSISHSFNPVVSPEPANDQAATPASSPGCGPNRYRAGATVNLAATAVSGRHPVWGSSPTGTLSSPTGLTVTLTMPAAPTFIHVIYFND